MGMCEGCEPKALALLSEAVDFIACKRGPANDGTVDVVDGLGDGVGDGFDEDELAGLCFEWNAEGMMGEGSAELVGTGVDRADSND